MLTCVQLPPTIEEALRAADELMYAVKRTRKNMIKYATLDEIELAR